MRRAEVASAEAKQSLERQGDYRSVQKRPRAPRRRSILYSFAGAVPTIIQIEHAGVPVQISHWRVSLTFANGWSPPLTTLSIVQRHELVIRSYSKVLWRDGSPFSSENTNESLVASRLA